MMNDEWGLAMGILGAAKVRALDKFGARNGREFVAQ
jgi:hypothetical protein